jgi:hypothetical protein
MDHCIKIKSVGIKENIKYDRGLFRVHNGYLKLSSIPGVLGKYPTVP